MNACTGPDAGLFQEYFLSLPCYVTIQNRDLKVIAANRKFMADFGDWEGRYCYQVYKNRPEKCESCPVEKTFRYGQQHSSEEVVRCNNGREVSVLVNTTPIRDAEGNITAVMEMSTDVTEIKMLQQQLRESQNRYKLLFEEVPCYISIQDRDLRIVEANRLHREAFGTFLGCHCFEVYKHRDEECFPCTVRQTFEDAQDHWHEEVVTNKAGEAMNVMVLTAPVRNGLGNITHVIEMSSDITRIRTLQDQLTSIGMLISSISHGIKGMLNGLNGGIYLVNKGLEKDDRSRLTQGWEIVQRNITRIRSMVLDILYYAKDREPVWEYFDAAELAEEVASVTEPKAGELGIGFVKLFEPTGKMDADPKALRALLVNLVENSLDACRLDKKKETHSVVFSLSGNERNVWFEVKDNGIGMDQETREKAFSLFFSSKGSEGTGLGLFIAQKIAAAHGGRIELESEVNQGSRFRVILPRRSVALSSPS